jgi:predicted metal-dependent hydrolase
MTLFLVSIAAGTVAILAVMVISLFRQVRRLAGSLQEFSAALAPALQDIQREGDRAQVLAERIEQGQRKREQEREVGRRRRPRRGRSKR